MQCQARHQTSLQFHKMLDEMLDIPWNCRYFSVVLDIANVMPPHIVMHHRLFNSTTSLSTLLLHTTWSKHRRRDSRIHDYLVRAAIPYMIVIPFRPSASSSKFPPADLLVFAAALETLPTILSNPVSPPGPAHPLSTGKTPPSTRPLVRLVTS